MDIRKEYKFALPTSMGLLFGILTGSFVFYLIVGTVFGLVWGYSDHMLGGNKRSAKTTKPAKTRRSSKKTSKRKKK